MGVVWPARLVDEGSLDHHHDGDDGLEAQATNWQVPSQAVAPPVLRAPGLQMGRLAELEQKKT